MAGPRVAWLNQAKAFVVMIDALTVAVKPPENMRGPHKTLVGRTLVPLSRRRLARKISLMRVGRSETHVRPGA